MDIVERSKKAQSRIEQVIGENVILREINRNQAQEIERLREALKSIANNTCCDRCQEAALVARSALQQKEDE